MTANMDDIRLFHIIMSEVKIGVFSSALAPCSLTLSQGLRSMTSQSVAVFSINEKTLRVFIMLALLYPSGFLSSFVPSLVREAKKAFTLCGFSAASLVTHFPSEWHGNI